MEWSWLSALYLPLLIENASVRDFLLPSENTTKEAVAASSGEPSLFLMIIALLITAFVVIGSVVILIRLPMKIAKTGHAAAKRTAVAAVPIIVHHKKITKKKQKLLTARVIAWLKLSAIIVPLIGLIGIYFVELQLSEELFILVTAAFALAALINFVLQYSIAYVKRVPSDSIL